MFWTRIKSRLWDSRNTPTPEAPAPVRATAPAPAPTRVSDLPPDLDGPTVPLPIGWIQGPGYDPKPVNLIPAARRTTHRRQHPAWGHNSTDRWTPHRTTQGATR